MAMYNYTPNANYYSANESEEERRRREAEQAQAQQQGGVAPIAPIAPLGAEPEPIKQTITYDPVSGEQRMKIEGNARDLSAENPLTPTLTIPGSVSPEQLAQQQQMPQQQMPEMQAQMPQAQVPAPQQQMPQVQPEMAQPEMAPQMPQLPQPGPAVQVAGATQMPPAAQPAPEQPYTGPGQGAEAQTVGQSQFATEQPAAQPPATDPIGMFTSAVGDTNKLLQIYNDKNQPPELRRMAGREASRQLSAETQQSEAENKVKTMTPKEVQSELRKSDEEGSWVKRVIYGLLNMQGAMAAEDAKLGIGATFKSTTLNGQPVEIKVRADGKAMEGYNAQTLEPLSKKELVAAAAQMTTLKGANIGGQVYRDPVSNQTLTKVDTQQGPIYYDKAGNRTIPKGEPVPLTAGSDIATQLQLTQMRRQQAFVGQTAEARIRSYNELNNERVMAGQSPITPEQMGINRNGELIGQAQPQTPGLAQPAPTPTSAPAAAAEKAPPAVVAKAAPGGGVKLSPNTAAATPAVPAAGMTGAELAAQRAAKKDVAKEAAKQVSASADTQNILNSIGKVTDLIDSGDHNLGSALSGTGLLGGGFRGPIAQAIGKQFETKDARNTSTILDTVRKLAADGLKVLGSNPSTVDLQFWTANKPNETSDPAYVKSWIESRAADLKRRLGYAESQLGKGGGAGGAPEVPAQPRITTRPSVSRW
jgi:hypothetical protein